MHDGVGDRIDHAERGKREREDARKRHHQQDHGRELARLAQDGVQVPEPDGAVDAHAHEEPVEHGHHGGFGRREPARAHAAQYQHWRGQAPGSLAQALPEGRAGHRGFQRAHFVAARQPHGRHDQRDAGQHAGHHARREQRGHRSAGHQHRIDDEGDRRRDQDVGGGGRADHAGRERAGVARARHGSDHDPAHGGRVGGARAGDAAQEHRHGDGHQRQHARAAPDDGHREVHEPQRHPGAVEDRADQYEHGNREQRVLAEPGIEVLRHRQQPEPGRFGIRDRDGGRAGQAERGADRHAGGHHAQEDREKKRRDHGRSPFAPAAAPWRRKRPMARSVISADSSGSQMEYHHCGTPMPGDVSPNRQSSHVTRALSTAMTANRTATERAPKRARRRRRTAEPPSAKYSMRMCTSRATAAEPATSASTIIRKTEISSVHAKEELVK